MGTLVKNKSGFTLVELLMAMVTGIIVLAGIYAAFNSQQKIHTKESQVVDAEQNVRGAAHFMVREIRLAGMDQTGNAGAGILIAGPHSIQFTLDRNDDEDVLDTDENITYRFSVFHAADTDGDGYADSGAAPIARVTAGPDDILADDIHALGFAYAYDDDGDGELDWFDKDGDTVFDPGEEIWAYDSSDPPVVNGTLDKDNTTGDPLASAVTFDKIRAVRVWILARTRQEFRDYSGPKDFIVGDKLAPLNPNDNFKYRLLTHTVKCRNMGL